MRDFRQRSFEPELMDSTEISFDEFHHCLQSLETINKLTFGYRPTLQWLAKILPLMRHKSTRILDVGSGGGDMLRQIDNMAKHDSYNVKLIGVDMNPWSKKSAETSFPISSTRYETSNVFTFNVEEPVEIVICALFTHHLNDEQIIQFLRWIDEKATVGWFISDLHRHRLPYYFIKIMTKMFSRNRLIRNDAPLSVARSFTFSDWRRLLERANVKGQFHLKWFMPFRLCVSCQKI